MHTPSTTSANSKRELLARQIARSFGDEEHLNLYLTYCRKYPLTLVYRAYGEARATPPERVRKSRAAIFFYLIKRYDDERRENSGH